MFHQLQFLTLPSPIICRDSPALHEQNTNKALPRFTSLFAKQHLYVQKYWLRFVLGQVFCSSTWGKTRLFGHCKKPAALCLGTGGLLTPTWGTTSSQDFSHSEQSAALCLCTGGLLTPTWGTTSSQDFSRSEQSAALCLCTGGLLTPTWGTSSSQDFSRSEQSAALCLRTGGLFTPTWGKTSSQDFSNSEQSAALCLCTGGLLANLGGKSSSSQRIGGWFVLDLGLPGCTMNWAGLVRWVGLRVYECTVLYRAYTLGWA